MADYSNSVMIALLPITTDWAKQELPHLTLVYAGLVSDLTTTDHVEMLKIVSEIAMAHRPLQLRVLEPDVFGGNDGSPEVDVFKLVPTAELMTMRNRVERWNASEFPFNPHVTVGPKGSLNGNIPPALAFDRIVVSWGSNRTQFWLKQ